MRFKHSYSRGLLLLLMLSGLLLQAQSVFACSMMDLMGHSQECCCKVPLEAVTPASTEIEPAPCCEFSLELSLNELDFGSSPLSFSAQPDHSLPDSGGAYYWADGTAQPDISVVPAFHRSNLANAGRHTYLATLRLRI
jgi:hypothetical protein